KMETKEKSIALEEKYLYVYGIVLLKDLKPEKHKNQRFLAPENSEEIFKESENFQEQNNFDDTQIEDYGRCRYLYVYGIISLKDLKSQKSKTSKSKNREDFFGPNLNGLREKPITIIPYKDIGVLVSKYPFLNPILDEKEAMKHADILKKITKKTTIIPIAFGNVFNDEKILESVLKKSYNAIKECLEKINNKIELGVKVIKNNEDSMITDEDKITAEILNSLNNLSVTSAQGEKFSERLLLNHSFLVEKNNFPKFSNAIAKLEKKYKQFKFIYTGPWSPYSFVNIHIRGQK
ncbi:MAG: GvpL/GvpF family gas vesicle protein, partial [Nanoarchaeota archaeon]|nr:GvpL/GvpF family gas vesicle protein [Nanoarchaeota archaeon]